jgi:ABC-type multidrug transport system fused ATPase/permease subunit
VNLGNSVNTLAPLFTFAVFVIGANSTGRTLNTASAYTALSLISLLDGPMNTLVSAIPMLNAAMACFARIESFLNSDARRDDRLPLLGQGELGDQSSPPTGSVNKDIEMESLRPVLTGTKINSVVIATQNASFSWDIDGQPTVFDLSFTLHRHQFCFVIGPVGSGKSTMLKGLLGETPASKGFVYQNYQETSFVGQTPWIRNGTIQENILGISSYEDAWYKQVANACGLEGDVLILPKGHGMAPK